MTVYKDPSTGKIIKTADGKVAGAAACCCCEYPLCITIEWDLLYTDYGVDPNPDVTYPVTGSATLWLPSQTAAPEEVIRTFMDGIPDQTYQAGATLFCDGSEIQEFYVTGTDVDVAYSLIPDATGNCVHLAFYVYELLSGGGLYNAKFQYPSVSPDSCWGNLTEGVNTIDMDFGTPPDDGVTLTGTITITTSKTSPSVPCGCEYLDTCWIVEFDIEFLSKVYWDTLGATGVQWLPYVGNQVLWVDVDDNSNDRRTCNDGVPVDESNPGPPGWAISIPDAYAAAGNIEAGDCEEWISLYLQTDFATGAAPSVNLVEGVNTISITEDLSGETPSGSVTQEVIRGTITLTLVYPSEKGDCACP